MNYTDENGLRQGKWKLCMGDVLWYMCFFKNSKKNGWCIFYFDDSSTISKYYL